MTTLNPTVSLSRTIAATYAALCAPLNFTPTRAEMLDLIRYWRKLPHDLPAIGRGNRAERRWLAISVRLYGCIIGEDVFTARRLGVNAPTADGGRTLAA